MEKKSVSAAKAEAMKLSKNHINILYRVMDKKRKKAVCVGSEWVYRELILDGWFTVTAYKAGEEVKAVGT